MMKILNLMFLSVLYGVPYDGLTLITDIGQAGQGGGENEGYETQLIDNELNIINSWFYDTRPSSIAYLSPDSILYLTCKVNQNEGAGPNGGRFKKIDWYGNVIWDYDNREQRFEIITLKTIGNTYPSRDKVWLDKETGGIYGKIRRT